MYELHKVFFFIALTSLPSPLGTVDLGDGQGKPLSELAIWQQPETILFLAPGGWSSGSVVYCYYYSFRQVEEQVEASRAACGAGQSVPWDSYGGLGHHGMPECLGASWRGVYLPNQGKLALPVINWCYE